MSTQNVITVDDSAINRISSLRENEAVSTFDDKTYLRIAVLGGGCSGFQYEIGPDKTVNEDDTIYNDSVIIDSMSLIYLRNSVIKFSDEMVGAKFVVDNPNVQSSCGCQTSFAVNPSVFEDA